MKLGQECRYCLLKSQTHKVDFYINYDKKKIYLEKLEDLCLHYGNNLPSPLLMRQISLLHQEIFGFTVDYSQEKIKFNNLCLSYESRIEELIEQSEDKLLLAIKFAIVGNLIDFAKFDKFDEDLFPYFKEQALSQELDESTYLKLKEQLAKAKKITYLLDNCGEVVFDKILIRIIKELYPSLEVIVVVRGKEIINDCTYFDTSMVGLDKIAKIIDNGTDIPGTYLEEISSECKETMLSSDLIISKGLGNVETLHGSKLNIFYLFLVKCEFIANLFGLKLFQSALCNELDLIKKIRV